METHCIDFSKTNMFSKKFNEFVEGHTGEDYFPSYKNLEMVTGKVKLPRDHRETLSDVISDQYGEMETSEKVRENIDSLKAENSFTVTTGHQLNIFSGPLYIIYKIISTIKLSENLNAKHPEKKFIPVYWMASEDHDFDEIKAFFSRGKTYEWDIETSGAVGDIDPGSIKKLAGMIPDSVGVFEEAYSSSRTLSEAVRKYMNTLFKSYGLVVFDPSSSRLKSISSELMSADILENTTSHVERSSPDKSDVYVRKINFFYMREGLRSRIESVGDGFTVSGTDIKFSREEMGEEIEKHPERFSPNVVMRCLYQQTVMPNVAYVGGPAEVIYWLGFRKFFREYGKLFPVIVPRDSVLIISGKSSKTLDRYGLDLEDIFMGRSHLEKKAIGVLSDEDKNFSTEISRVRDQFESMAKKFKSVDKTMSPHVLANAKKTEKMLSQVEKRFIKSQKDQDRALLSKVGALYYDSFPEGTPQERKENIMTFYTSTLLEELHESLDPMELKFKIIR